MSRFQSGEVQKPEANALQATDRQTDRLAHPANLPVASLMDRQFKGRVTAGLACAADPHPTYLCVDREILTWERVAEMAVEATSSRSAVNVIEPVAPTPVPRFRTDLLEGLLGRPSDARNAMKAHIAHLAARRAR